MSAYRHLYFLYVWTEPRDDATLPPLLRYRLEDAATHEQYLFSQVDQLMTFLQKVCAVPCYESSGAKKMPADKSSG